MDKRLPLWIFAVAAVATMAIACSPSARGPNRPPVANAGPDQKALAGKLVLLDGNASFDPDADPLLGFQWTISAAPPGAQAELQAGDSVVAALQPDKTGVWLIRLVVFDGKQWSLPDVAELRVYETGCRSDADCNDGVLCTADSCDSAHGFCVNQPHHELCPDDGIFCNGGEFCHPEDGCSHGGNPCLVPENCDEDNDNCGACGNGTVDVTNGEECDFGPPQLDHCCHPTECRWTGVGYPDPQAVCSGAPECKIDVCDGQGNCILGNAADGTLCTQNEFFCDGPERCQQGNCVSEGNPCPHPADCDEGNDTCAGCGLPPANMSLECRKVSYLPMQKTSACRLELPPGMSGAVDCLNCRVRGVPLVLAHTNFAAEDGISCAELERGLVDGWSVVGGLSCYSNTTSRPLSGEDSRSCCTNFTCPTFSGQVAFQADDGTCTNNPAQWRLQRTFDTTGLQNLELCFDYASRDAGGNNDVLQVEVRDLRDDSNRQVLYYDENGPRDGLDDVWFRKCFNLPSFASNNPALQVLFFLHSEGNNNRLYLDNITLRGEPISCPTPRKEIWVESFENCPNPLADWNGWTVEGTPLACDTGFVCFAGKRVKTNNTLNSAGSLSRYFDLSNHSAAELCFYYGENGADAGELLTVYLDSGSGWNEIWSRAQDFGQNSTCAQVCLPLSEMEPAVDHNPHVGIRFSLQANNKEIALDQVVLSAALDCSADVPLSLSALHDNGDGTYDFRVADSNQQMAGQVVCAWANGEPEASAPVVFRTADLLPSNLDPVHLCTNSKSLRLTQAATIDTNLGRISGVDDQNIVFTRLPQEPGVPELGVFSFDSIAIEADVTVVGTHPLVLLSCHGADISGKIDVCGRNRLAGPGGDNGGFTAADGFGEGAGRGGQSFNYDDSGGGGAGYADYGGAGGVNNATGGAAGEFYGNPEIVPLRGGSGGGGGGGAGGQGGGGGGAVQISARGVITISSPGGINACGAGGGVPLADGYAGGGGGSGGAILIEALDILGNGTLAANGGGGGGGDNWGDDWVTSGPGDNGPFGRGRAAGGASSGNGGEGGAGGGAFDMGGDAGVSDTNAGGGGGAAGRIRLNTLSGKSTLSTTGVTSPAPGTAGLSEGQLRLP